MIFIVVTGPNSSGATTYCSNLIQNIVLNNIGAKIPSIGRPIIPYYNKIIYYDLGTVKLEELDRFLLIFVNHNILR